MNDHDHAELVRRAAIADHLIAENERLRIEYADMKQELDEIAEDNERLRAEQVKANDLLRRIAEWDQDSRGNVIFPTRALHNYIAGLETE